MAESDEEERPLSNAKAKVQFSIYKSPFAATEEEDEKKKKKKNIMKSRRSMGGRVDGEDGWMDT